MCEERKSRVKICKCFNDVSGHVPERSSATASASVRGMCQRENYPEFVTCIQFAFHRRLRHPIAAYDDDDDDDDDRNDDNRN